MKKIAFFDTKSYDKASFDAVNKDYEIIYIESKLNGRTAIMAKGCEAVCAFVNDDLGKETVKELDEAAIDRIISDFVRTLL